MLRPPQRHPRGELPNNQPSSTARAMQAHGGTAGRPRIALQQRRPQQNKHRVERRKGSGQRRHLDTSIKRTTGG
eukprot:31121-Chlamydomonas_euryale.AAC.3